MKPSFFDILEQSESAETLKIAGTAFLEFPVKFPVLREFAVLLSVSCE